MFTLREYQQHTLDALRQYFQTCVQLNSAGTSNAGNVAFYRFPLDNFGVLQDRWGSVNSLVLDHLSRPNAIPELCPG